MATKNYCMLIYEGETVSRTIESDTPFLPIHVGDTLTCGDSRVRYGTVKRIAHWLGPVGGEGGPVRHEIHVYCDD